MTRIPCVSSCPECQTPSRHERRFQERRVQPEACTRCILRALSSSASSIRDGPICSSLFDRIVSRTSCRCNTVTRRSAPGNATPAQVSELLAENIVFNSPILVRPIEGRQVIAAIFTQSSSTRGSGTYTAEFKLDERTTFLRWEGTMNGHKFESLEVIVDNEQGLIVERTIALRPYPALKLFRDAMYASLKDKLPPDVWDYPTP